MPMYEFECGICGQKFSILSKTYDSRHWAVCPYCNSLAERMVSLVNHSFGWRLTDRCHDRFGPKEEFERDI